MDACGDNRFEMIEKAKQDLIESTNIDMENCEQKYQKALSRAKYYHDRHNIQFLENIFPELRESGDERIRKALLEYFGKQCDMSDCNGIYGYEVYDWLKKQGEKVDAIENFDTEFEKQVSHLIASAINKEHEYNRGYVKWAANALLNYAKHELKKLCEQKPTDKVETKFKARDWITNGECTWKVTAIKQLDYILQSQNGDTVDDIISHVDEYFHLWTIQDAKDGDVLATDSGRPFIFKGLLDMYHPKFPVAYCGIDPYNYFDDDSDNDNEWWAGENVYPATKEQRDILFQKMKEAGYEWDDEKKELKKIEQKAARSEDDEKHINLILRVLDMQQCWDGATGKKFNPYQGEIDWFKSLKDKVQSQPKQD